MTTQSFYGLGNTFRNDGISAAALLQYQKRWRWVEFLILLSGPITFTLEWWPGESAIGDQAYGRLTNVVATSVNVYDAGGNALRDAAGNQITAPNLRGVIRAKLLPLPSSTYAERYMHSRGIRLRLSATSSTHTWSLAGMLLAYQLLPGLKREFVR